MLFSFASLHLTEKGKWEAKERRAATEPTKEAERK
jgi:hypothetical protein